MKATAEKIEKAKVQVSVEIPVDEFEASLQKAYKIVVNKVNIPGFRKGKAPRRILENMFGREILMEDALQEAIPKAYLQAIEEHKEEFIPVSEPKYEMVQTELDKPIVFKATFDIKPEVKLGKYKGIELEQAAAEVTEELIADELGRMQQRYAKIADSDGPAVAGDTLTIDFVGKVDGIAFAGGTANDHSLTLGSNSFIPGFEDQLIGVACGEVKDVAVTFPAEYHAEELKGKDAVFTVTVKEIKQQQVSPLDDEFAKDVSEFDTLQELKQDIENKLQDKLKKDAERALRETAISTVTKNAEVEIPSSMIDKRANNMLEEFAYRLEQQGISMDYYFQATGRQIQDLLDSYRPGAEIAVKSDLVLEAIIREEAIQVTEEELYKEVEKIAEQYNQDAANILKTFEMQGHIPALEFGVKAEKAVDMIIKEAKLIG